MPAPFPIGVVSTLGFSPERATRDFELGPRSVELGLVELGGWQIHLLDQGTDEYPGFDAYLVGFPYGFQMRERAPGTMEIEVTFDLGGSGSVLDVVPRDVTRPTGPTGYGLTRHLNFTSAAGPGNTSYPVPALEPTIETSGVGTSRLTVRHVPSAPLRRLSHAGWFVLLTPTTLRELPVWVTARTAQPALDPLASVTVVGPAVEQMRASGGFTVRLPLGHTNGRLRGRPVEPAADVRPRVAFVFDIHRYSDLDHSAQEAAIGRVEDLANDVIGDLGYSYREVDLQTTGDGVMVVLPIDVDFRTIVPRLLRHTTDRLTADNRAEGPENRLRLRMAVSFDTVANGRLALTGNVPKHLSRLVDSDAIRAPLTPDSPYDLVVLISDWLYHRTVAQRYPDHRPEEFTGVTALAKNFQEPAWRWLPNVATRLPAST